MPRRPNPKTKLTPPPADDWALYIFGALLLISPLIGSGLTHFSGVFDQALWTMGIIFLGAAGFVWRLTKATKMEWTWLDAAVGLWWVWLVITTITSVNPTASLWSSTMRNDGLIHFTAIVVLYFLVRQLVSSKAETIWHYIITGVALIGSATALVGLMKFWLGTQDSAELIGILGNQNFTAYFLMMTLTATYWLWLKTKPVWNWWLVALIIHGAALWYANPRWVLMTAVIIIVGMSIVALVNWKVERMRVWILSIGLAVVGLGLIANFTLGGKLKFDFSYRTWQHRVAAWEIGWQAASDRPIFGWGLANYDMVREQYFKPAFEDALGHTEVLDNPHNFILTHVIGTGWVGLGLLLALLGMALLTGLRRWREPLAIWAIATILTYIVLNLLGFETIVSTMVLGLALGFLGGLATPLWTLRRAWPMWLAGTLSGLFLAATIYFAAIPWLSYQSAWRAAQAANIDKFYTSLTLAPQLRPELSYFLLTWRSPLPLLPGNAYTELARKMEKYQGHYRRNAGYQLAIAKAWEGSDSPQKLTQMKRLIEYGLKLQNYNNGYYWIFLATIELHLNNIPAAEAALERAKALNPDSEWTRRAIDELTKGIEEASTDEEAIETTTP